MRVGLFVGLVVRWIVSSSGVFVFPSNKAHRASDSIGDLLPLLVYGKNFNNNG